MKRLGFEKARARLADAFKAFEDLKVSQDWVAFESAWTRLLTSLNSVYSVLEQSAKGAPRSEVWFAKLKRERKADEALSYLHQARNVNDHGIANILARRPGGTGVRHPSGSMYIKELRAGPTGIEHLEGWGPDGSPLEIVHYPESVELIPIVARSVRFDPPRNFLGDQLKEPTPVGLAAKVLEYMTVLFVDAEELLI